MTLTQAGGSKTKDRDPGAPSAHLLLDLGSGHAGDGEGRVSCRPSRDGHSLQDTAEPHQLRVCTEPHTEEMKVQPKISPPRPPCCCTALLLPSAFLPVVQHVGAEPPSAHSPGGAGHSPALSQGTRGHRRAWQRLHWPFLTAGTHRHLLSPEPNSSPEGAAGQRVQGGGELR